MSSADAEAATTVDSYANMSDCSAILSIFDISYFDISHLPTAGNACRTEKVFCRNRRNRERDHGENRVNCRSVRLIACYKLELLVYFWPNPNERMWHWITRFICLLELGFHLSEFECSKKSLNIAYPTG